MNRKAVIKEALNIATEARKRGVHSTAVSVLDKVTQHYSTSSKIGGHLAYLRLTNQSCSTPRLTTNRLDILLCAGDCEWGLRFTEREKEKKFDQTSPDLSAWILDGKTISNGSWTA